MYPKINNLKKDLSKDASVEKAVFLSRFFKTGVGEYAYGDKFIGVTVPVSRSIAKKYKDLDLNEIANLITSKIHEERLVALFILVEQFKKAEYSVKTEIYNFYLKNTQFINNWDLVDLSSEKIIGEYLSSTAEDPVLYDSRKINSFKDPVLQKLMKSKNLWERRIAVTSTFAFIKRGVFENTLEVAKALLSDKNDLIQKAVGWMLREVGKRDQKIEEDFLKKYYKRMPRTMLRYAIERFEEISRQKYLHGKV